MTDFEFYTKSIQPHLQAAQNGCLVWPYARTEKGYGVVFDGRTKKTVRAHRAVWKAFHGEFTGQVLHKCDNKSCANIEHLYLGAHRDNVDDAVKRDRYKKGSAHYLSLLTDGQAIEILYWLASGLGISEIAKKYQIPTGPIKGIKAGKSWKHVLNSAL